MTVTSEATWRDAYVGVAESLAAAAPSAAPALTGASACVDTIFRIDADRFASLVRAADAAPGSTNDAHGHELLTQVLERMLAGRGGELLRRWPDGPAWMCRLLGEPDRRQLGGTAPQASWALAVLGAPSVLALADRSAEQMAVLDPRIGLCVDGKVVPVGTVVPFGDPLKLPHCILEFTAGVAYDGGVLSRSTRLILRFGDEPLECDEQFAALTPTLSGPRAGLLSGLNGLPDDDTASRGWLVELGESWAASGLETIHFELAEFPSVERLRGTLDTSVATSIGLSLSELYALAGRRGDPRLIARDAAQRCGARRIVVHADDWALAVHRDDPRHQRDVLLAGSVMAAARALAGTPSDDLTPPAQAEYTDDVPMPGDLGAGWQATSVASPHLRRPTATIGLGDTFVAGLLLAESLP